MIAQNCSVITPVGLRILRDVKIGDRVWTGDFWDEVVHISESETPLHLYHVNSACARLLCSAGQEFASRNVFLAPFKATHTDICIGPVFWEAMPEKRITSELPKWLEEDPYHLIHRIKKVKHSKPNGARWFLQDLFTRYGVYESGAICLKYPQKQFTVYQPISLMLLMLGVPSVVSAEGELAILDGQTFIERVGFSTKEKDGQYQNLKYETPNYDAMTQILSKDKYDTRPTRSLYVPSGVYWCEGCLVRSTS